MVNFSCHCGWIERYLLMWYMCRFVYEEKFNQKEKTLFVNSTTSWDRGFELNENWKGKINEHQYLSLSTFWCQTQCDWLPWTIFSSTVSPNESFFKLLLSSIFATVWRNVTNTAWDLANEIWAKLLAHHSSLTSPKGLFYSFLHC